MFSGGMDSSLLLIQAQWSGVVPVPLFVDYGQPHLEQELAAARSQVGDHLRVVKTSLSGGIVGREESPVVPGRNAALLSIGVNLAVVESCGEVWFGACRADAVLFPDCRQEFVDAYNAMLEAQGVGVVVKAPLVNNTKREIRDMLGRMLSRTWSCYFPIDGRQCGQCGACKARVSED